MPSFAFLIDLGLVEVVFKYLRKIGFVQVRLLVLLILNVAICSLRLSFLLCLTFSVLGREWADRSRLSQHRTYPLFP